MAYSGILRDLTSSELQRETLIERWRQTVWLANRTAKRLAKHKGELTIKFDFAEGKPLASGIATPDDMTMRELAVALRPLLHPTSELHYAKFLELFATSAPEIQEEIAKLVAAIQARQQSPFIVNGGPLRGEDSFVLLADRVFFCNDGEANEFRAELETTPEYRDMLWFTAYNYCIDMARLLNQARERLGTIGAFKRVPRTNLCIYCRSTEAAFATAEHTLPQSLGNTLSILPRGYTCDQCQNRFSAFEGRAIKSVPFSLQRFLMVNQTKDGKFTSAKFAGMHLQRTSPNSIKINALDKRSFKVEDLGNGESKLTFAASGKVDHISIGRMLVKAALGGMAMDFGRSFVLDTKFDPARAFILTGTGLDARIFLATQSKPKPGIAVQFLDGDRAFGAVFMIYGMHFIVQLTPSPFESIPPELAAEFVAMDLANPTPPPHAPRISEQVSP